MILREKILLQNKVAARNRTDWNVCIVKKTSLLCVQTCHLGSAIYKLSNLSEQEPNLYTLHLVIQALYCVGKS